MRKFVALFTVLLIALILPVLASGVTEDTSTFPSKPITLTVPFGAGGNADVLAKAVANKSQEFMGQSIGVVNRTGAGGVVGLSEFVNKDPDGYNLITVNIGLFAVTPQTQKVSYTFDDLEPVIGNIGDTFITLSVLADSPIRTIEDLKAYGKDHIIKYSVIGIGSDQHILQAALYHDLGVKANPVSYTSATEPVSALLGGNIDVICTLSTVINDYVETGKIIPLVTFNANSELNFKNFGTVPSAVALGYDIEYVGFNFYALPKGTDKSIVQFYHDKIQAIYKTQDIIDLQKKLNFIVDPIGPEEILKRIEKGTDDVSKWLLYV
jgi:tripartite-type tricarboxylate transporter receptor subunit TctC